MCEVQKQFQKIITHKIFLSKFQNGYGCLPDRLIHKKWRSTPLGFFLLTDEEYNEFKRTHFIEFLKANLSVIIRGVAK